MKHDREAIERFIYNRLVLGDRDHAPAIGAAHAIDRAYLLAAANANFRPLDPEEPWTKITDELFRNIYANSEAGICCADTGIFLAAGPDDIRATEDYLMAKIRGTGRRIARIRRAYPQFGPYRNQLLLPGLEEADEPDELELEDLEASERME
jgi:hypothetical protein